MTVLWFSRNISASSEGLSRPHQEPQAVWRALEFLHEKQLCDSVAMISPNQKTSPKAEKRGRELSRDGSFKVPSFLGSPKI